MTRLLKDGNTILSRIQTLLKIDRAITFALLTSIVPLFAGPITALLIATKFSPELQGYYFAFGSFTAIQFFIELGLGQSIIQFASHEWSNLHLNSTQNVTGSEQALSRLVSLGRLSLKWYSASAVLTILSLFLFGPIFFNKYDNSIHWGGPWAIMALGLGVNLLLTPLFNLFLGCNQINQYWFYRFIQQIINGLSLWVGILLGLQLWTIPLATGMGLLWSLSFLIYHRRFFTIFWDKPTGDTISWRHEVWPIQWRIALTWFGAYFISQLFTLALFRIEGPVRAGQMGMVNTLAGVVLALSSNWVLTKAPKFGQMVAKQQFAALDKLFFSALRIATVLAILAAASAVFLVFLLNYFNISLGNRLLPWSVTAFFLGATAINCVIVSISAYLRAYKKEPLMPVAVTSTIIIVVMVFTIGRWLGALGIGIGYLATMALFNLPFSWYIFQKSRQEWQRVAQIG